MSLARRAWRCRWGAVRLAVALAALWFLLADTASRLTRLQLASLPEMDYAAEVRHLRESGRYAEALTVAEAGLTEDGAQGEARVALEREHVATMAEQSSWLRRAGDAGMGALSGQASSVEGLVGAIAADMLVVGDIRDLVLQGGKQVLDGDSDEIILLLSAAGLATTLSPQIDWAPALLKVARKTGAMTVRMADHIRALVKGRRTAELRALFESVARLARGSSPAQAVRLLRFADDPKDVATLARFVEREKAGAFALHVTGKEGAAAVKAADAAGGAADAVRAGDRVLVAAARKGPAGMAWLRTGNARLLLRPHPLIGLLKGVYKGNVEQLVARALSAADGRAWWLIPLLAAWAFAETAVMARRLAAPDGRAAPAVA